MARRLYISNAPVKSKRKQAAHATNHVSWAFDRFLREHANGTVYPINPYIQVFQFRENLYGFYNHNLDGQDDMWQYLLIGPEKAMLVDTGYGIGDVVGLINQLTGGKELVVVNTHDHPDHAYGNCCFDKVYCHETLVPYLELQDEHIHDYLFNEDGSCKWIEFDKEDLPKFKPFEIVGVPDGYIINLGEDYDVEVIHVGGHAGGHAVYLDKKGKNLFAGDCICSDIMQLGNITDRTNRLVYKAHNGRVLDPAPQEMYRTPSVFLERIKYIVSRLDEFDHIFPGHYITDLEADLYEDLYKALSEIIADPINNCTFTKVMPDGKTVYRKYIEGFSMISYRFTH